jgi:hypothetical protein
MEVLDGAELQGSEGNTGSLLDSGYHRAFMVLHQENLPKASLLHPMAEAGNCSSNANDGRSGVTHNEWDDKTKKHPYPRCGPRRQWLSPTRQWSPSSRLQEPP